MINIVLVALIAILRIIGLKTIAFQALAHFVVGGNFYAWGVMDGSRWKGKRVGYLALALFLTLVECAAFAYGLKDHR